MLLDTLRQLLMPLSLSRALSIVERMVATNGQDPHWFQVPVEELIEVVGDIPVTDVTEEHIRQWYEHVKSRPNQRNPKKKLSPWTIDHYARSMKSFFGHLQNMGHIDRDPTRALRLPKLPKKSKKEISPEDIDKLVTKSKRDWRDHAIVLVLRDSGVRVSGLVSMRVSGLHIEERDGRLRGRALVDSKGQKTRYIFFGHDASEAIQVYLDIRPVDAPDELWLSKRGDTPLTRSGVYQMLKRYADRAGVERFNPHSFRHALAKRMLDNGHNPEYVKEILGHEDVVTTLSMYVTYDEEELADRHAQFLDDTY